MSQTGIIYTHCELTSLVRAQIERDAHIGGIECDVQFIQIGQMFSAIVTHGDNVTNLAVNTPPHQISEKAVCTMILRGKAFAVYGTEDDRRYRIAVNGSMSKTACTASDVFRAIAAMLDQRSAVPAGG
jgi:hypothetical protein